MVALEVSKLSQMTTRAFIKHQAGHVLPSISRRGRWCDILGKDRATKELIENRVSLNCIRGYAVASRVLQQENLTRKRRSFSSRHSGLVIAALSTGTAELGQDSKEREVDLSDFVLDGGKTTSVAHGVWRRVVRPGDTVIDATCGNGNDTLALAKMVCKSEAMGYVYAFDVQEDALANTSYFLDKHLDSAQRKQVKLLHLCHSQLESVVEMPIRLVAFNLGYLPGGDKSLITGVLTTLQALQAASNVLQSGGLISIVAYIGHKGGREEFEAVVKFAASLPPTIWVCSYHEWINRPLGPRLIFLFKK